MTLTEFLLARIDEDEANQRRPRGRHEVDGDWHAFYCDINNSPPEPCDCGVPARVLAECDAKRRIVREHPDDGEGFCERCHFDGTDAGGMRCEPYSQPCPTLSALALPYAQHPDYTAARRWL